VHVHVSEKYHNIRLAEMFECLERHGISLVHGMVESWILLQLFMLVLERVPSNCEEVPFPSCVGIRLSDVLLCSIMCTKLEVILVLVFRVPYQSSE
jgi:hypothetical protein